MHARTQASGEFARVSLTTGVRNHGTLGPDILNGVKGEANDIYGDALDLQGNGAHGGDDTLTGGANSPLNNLYGDAFSFTGPAHGGDDTLTGGANSINYLFGDADTMSGGPSTCGNDTLIGGIGGTNYLYGDAVESGGGDDVAGNDILVSAARTTDYMWGDFASNAGGTDVGGHDTFVFGPHNGNDFIYDFHQGGEDFIEIDAKKPETFTDLNIQVVDANNDGTMDSVIQFDSHDSVTVYGVTGLQDADFHFVMI